MRPTFPTLKFGGLCSPTAPHAKLRCNDEHAGNSESARHQWNGFGRDDLQPDSGGALMRAIGGHHLLDVHQDCQGVARLQWEGLVSFLPPQRTLLASGTGAPAACRCQKRRQLSDDTGLEPCRERDGKILKKIKED